MHESNNTGMPAAPASAGPWGMVPIWILDPDQYLPAVDPATLREGDDKPLNGTDLRVYVALRSFADPDGRCWPTTRTVAERACAGKSTTEKAIGKLRRIGLLTSEVRYRADGSIAGCVYLLRNGPPTAGAPSDSEGGTLESEGGVPQDSRGGTPESEGGVPANPEGGTPESGGAGTDQGTHQGNTPPSSLRPATTVPAGEQPREKRGRKSLDEQARAEGWRLLHDVRGYSPEEARRLVNQLTDRHGVYSPQWWRTAHGNDTLDDRIAEVVADYQATRDYEPGAAPTPPARPAGRRTAGRDLYRNQPDQAYLDWVGSDSHDHQPEAAA